MHLGDGGLDEGLSELKAARAMSAGDVAEVDAAADRFIPALQAVLTHDQGLRSYYESHA